MSENSSTQQRYIEIYTSLLKARGPSEAQVVIDPSAQPKPEILNLRPTDLWIESGMSVNLGRRTLHLFVSVLLEFS